MLATVIIIGTIFINQKSTSTENNYEGDVESIMENNNFDTIEVSSLNEINCELSENTITRSPTVQNDYYKTEDGKVEINISLFDINVQERYIYNLKVITDGIILFYNEDDKNYIEKLSMNGESYWKLEIASNYEFNNLLEIDDGYFILGTEDSYSITETTTKKNMILKLNKQGVAVIARYFDDKMSNVSFVDSDAENIKIAGKNVEGSTEIITYDISGNQIEVLNTNLMGITPRKIVENNGYYYGIGKNENQEQLGTQYYFKIDSAGNEIFSYDIVKKEGLEEYTSIIIDDISVNDDYMYIVFGNIIDDVYAFDLEGNLVKKFGYNTNNILDKGHIIMSLRIRATDKGINIYGETIEGEILDIVSNKFDFQYRVNIPQTKLCTRYSSEDDRKLSDGIYISGKKYDESSILIRQYKF